MKDKIDVKCYFEYKQSPLYLCSLDAEKCFDSIWHAALFFKLIDRIPDDHWLTLWRWYGGLRAAVRWSHAYSQRFAITKGTRQGSIMSPQLFNIFIDDLLKLLSVSDDGVSIGSHCFSASAYADDICMMSSTVPGLQRLIDICTNYAEKWRFRFNPHKTKCLISGRGILKTEPKWLLNGDVIENVSCIEILGVHYSVKQDDVHVRCRIEKCKRCFYSLSDVGLSYPGCNSGVKAYLWNSNCQPVLLYGLDAIHVSSRNLKELEKMQSILLKRSLGLDKRSRTTGILQAMRVRKIEERLKHGSASLIKRICNVPNITRKLCIHFLSLYMLNKTMIPGTLVSKLLSFDLSPISCVFDVFTRSPFISDCGLTDSLRRLIMHENFIKPYSEEHFLATLLTRSY
jgi:hypothetical protein